MNRRKRRTVGTVLAFIVISGAAIWLTNRGGSAETKQVTENHAGQHSIVNTDPCPTEPRVAVAVLVVASASANPGTVAGQPAKPLIAGPDRTHPAPGSAGLFVIPAFVGISSAEQLANQVAASGEVSKAGVVAPFSSDPVLHSCDDYLGDSPAAAALADAAGKAMVSAGLVSQDAVTARGHAWSLTDDPLDSALVIITLTVPDGPDLSATPFASPASGLKEEMVTTIKFAALVNRHSGTVIAVGYSAF